ncbi:MAG: hypothetical protein HY352_03250 [Candidatus Omnitrophica bacterium]|nr:hypothetical protein [Candidatus Omnitrophota bacterium]
MLGSRAALFSGCHANIITRLQRGHFSSSPWGVRLAIRRPQSHRASITGVLIQGVIIDAVEIGKLAQGMLSTPRQHDIHVIDDLSRRRAAHSMEHELHVLDAKLNFVELQADIRH